MTSVDACKYSKHGGLNETFVLSSVDGKSISSLHYDFVDLEFLATRIKSAKKRRIMLTPDFSSWKTVVNVKPNNKGAVKPFFYEGLKQYNSMGGERVDRRARDAKGNTAGPAGAPKEDDRSFFGKYWMYIAIGLFVFSKFVDVGPEAGAA